MKRRRSKARTLAEIHDRLLAAFGPQHWWPADTPTEVVIGAILTQNTAWPNVERAIANLREAGRLTWPALHRLSEPSLAELIRPSGYFNVKAKRLKAFVDVVCNGYGGRLEGLLSGELDVVRNRLLAIHGVGPETADSILLYAGGRPTFVVDAYTRRVFSRHYLVQEDADYETMRGLCQRSLRRDVGLYSEYHALIVRVGKMYCGPRARCDGCPLAAMPHRT
ncbi:MAG: endonuclease III domain-containing protein [Phycisphaerae bacterium]